jgi:hypothetical protein
LSDLGSGTASEAGTPSISRGHSKEIVRSPRNPYTNGDSHGHGGGILSPGRGGGESGGGGSGGGEGSGSGDGGSGSGGVGGENDGGTPSGQLPQRSGSTVPARSPR